MNKKFYTLMAGVLLAGSTFNSANATDVTPEQFKNAIDANRVLDLKQLKLTDGKIELTGDVEFKDESNTTNPAEYVILNEAVTLTSKGDKKKTFTGRIVVITDNVTISNLKLVNSVINSTWAGFLNNTAISVWADKATIQNNEISGVSAEGNTNNVLDGIIIYPQTKDASYVIKGNTFSGFANVVDTKWYSSAIQVYQGVQKPANSSGNGDTFPRVMQGLNGVLEGTKTAVISFDAAAIKAGNTFKGNDADIFVRNGLDTETRPEGYAIDAAYVTNPAEAGVAGVKAALKDATAAEVINFDGTAAQLEALVGSDFNNNVDVAVACKDFNVLYGEAENPNNGKEAKIAGITPLDKEIGSYKLIENATSDYCLLILRGGDGNYVISTGETNLATKVDGLDLNEIAVDKKALWSMTWGTDGNGDNWYKFTNQAGDELTVNGKTGFIPVNNRKYHNGVVFAMNGLGLTDQTPACFGLYSVGYKTLAVKDLNWFESDGFSVTITCDVEKDGEWDDALEGDVFKGHLTPMTWNSSDVKFEVADEDAIEFYLKNEDGKYIVAKKYTGIGANDAQAVYTFDVVDEETLIHDLKDADSKKVYHGLFKANVSAKYTDYQKLEVIDKLFVKLPVGGWSNVGRYDLTSAEVPTLAASNATALKEIKVKFGGGKVVDKTKFVKAKFYTVTKLTKGAEKGYKLAVESDENYDYGTFVKSYGNELEGQWALIVEGGNYVFTNREATDCTWSLSTASLYYTDEENVYKYGSNLYKIETVDGTEATDGYETLPNVKANKFNLGYASNVFGGNAWFTENHTGDKNHVIGLDINSENALVFTAKEYAEPRVKKHENHVDYVYPTDSIYVISTLGYYEDNTQKFKQDTLKIVSYSFVNQFNEPLVYNYNDYRYESRVYKNETTKTRWENAEEASEYADRFAIRKDNGKKNLRLAYTNYVDKNSTTKHHEFSYYSKMYAGSTLDGMLSAVRLYSRTENDLFAVEPITHTLYRRLQNDVDTISIYRDENAKSLLYEKTTEIAKDQFVNFLGMENIADFTKMAPAMIADTAYVRNETYRPQYMLVVDPKIQPEGLWCEKDSSATCPHAVPTKGWVEGRYLVNLKDTAIAWDNANKHKQGNPYINSEKHYKLGFVQAKHYKDSLIIASTNDSIFVGGEDFNVAKFAFRYVDEAAGTFVIETANYKELPNAKAGERNGEGYLKWMNGVVVVVPNMADADVYNMNEDEDRTPTANEGVEVSEVSVVATNGAVIVKGAAGKTVAISNILGQTIANTVVASDNATIAVPAGIVVVAVEGEEAVKVVVK